MNPATDAHIYSLNLLSSSGMKKLYFDLNAMVAISGAKMTNVSIFIKSLGILSMYLTINIDAAITVIVDAITRLLCYNGLIKLSWAIKWIVVPAQCNLIPMIDFQA